MEWRPLCRRSSFPETMPPCAGSRHNPGMRALLLLLLAGVTGNGPSMTGPPAEGASLVSLQSERIDLRVGSTAALASGAVALTFVRVASDSRCPTGATCVWEGDAEVEFRLQRRGRVAQLMTLHTNPRFMQTASVDGVTVILEGLIPRPETDRPVAPDNYVATLRVEPP